MLKQLFIFIIILWAKGNLLFAQHISDFVSLSPGVQDANFHLPSTHSFQYIIEFGDSLSEGGTLPDRCDFTGYVPINGSSANGFLSINSETNHGGVTILDIILNQRLLKWIVKGSEAVDFELVGGTAKNCSGAVTPWGTIISCEETTRGDKNGDGYNDLGWAVEIDPVTRQVIDQNGGLTGGDKLWSLGNFKHENAVIHANRRTVYQGVDDTNGYLYKFVADVAEDLSSGLLYVYKGSKMGSGNWIQLNNSTATEQNSVLSQSANANATVFSGVEDVEINPIDNKIYLAVKSEDRVYRFDDSDPITGITVTNFETYVGGASYEINDGSNSVVEPWGTGNDNLIFDDLGNLWVTQDGDKNYTWIVENGHTQQSPKVKIFGRSPFGSEPTGITFTPDYKYLFMSIQHPSGSNSSTTQMDAFRVPRAFNKDVALVIARKDYLNGVTLSLTDTESVPSEGGDDSLSIVTTLAKPLTESNYRIYPNPASKSIIIEMNPGLVETTVQLFDINGHKTPIVQNGRQPFIEIPTDHLHSGIYFLNLILNGKNRVMERILISKIK